MTVVAEGVETAEQSDLLKAWGCHELQGYFFARPLPAAEMTTMLSAALPAADPTKARGRRSA